MAKDERQVYVCPTCGGSGYQQVSKGKAGETTTCKTCDGSGKILGAPT